MIIKEKVVKKSGFWIERFIDSKTDKLIAYNDSKGNWSRSEFDELGREIYFEEFQGFCKAISYFKDTDSILEYKDSSGKSFKNKYNEDGNLVYYSDNKGTFQQFSYKDGKMVRYFDEEGTSKVLDYDYTGDLGITFEKKEFMKL